MRRPTAALIAVVLLLLGPALTACDAGAERVADAGGAPSRAAEAPRRPAPPQALAWGPSTADLDAARAAVAAMSPEQVTGQVLVARFSGTDAAVAAELVRDHHLAGVILMGDNVVDAAQVQGVAAAVQGTVAASGRTWPGVVSVDQEGGAVARVDGLVTPFPSFMTHGAARDAGVTRAAAAASGAELRALGFTTVFAPVADVTAGPDDPTIGSRAASDDPTLVSTTVSAALDGYADAGVVAVAKHYPGHGGAPVDSHETLPVLSASADELAARDLLPFGAAAEAGAPAVMVGHLAVDAWEPGVPATLSPAAYGSLRGATGFDGLAVTDAMDMAAVTRAYGSGESAVRAVAAGADVVLMPADLREAHEALVAAVVSGELPRARVEEAAARVVAVQRWQAGTPVVAAGAGAASYAASLAGLTVVDGPCDGRLVGDAVQVTGGTGADRALFTEAADTAGLVTGSGDVVRLLGGATSSGEGDVVVALDAPFGLGASTAGSARIALYGRTPQAFAALVEVLLGRARAGGGLPVAVDGLEAGAGCESR